MARTAPVAPTPVLTTATLRMLRVADPRRQPPPEPFPATPAGPPASRPAAAPAPAAAPPGPDPSPARLLADVAPPAAPRSLADLARLAATLDLAPGAPATGLPGVAEPAAGWSVGPTPDHDHRPPVPATAPAPVLGHPPAAVLVAVEDIAGAAAVVESVLVHEARRWGLVVEDA